MSPRILTIRQEDVLEPEEVDKMFKQLEGKNWIRGSYTCKVYNKKKMMKETQVQTFRIDCRKTECLIALLWIFGRRIMEILMLRRKDIRIEGDSLIIRFITLKRHKPGHQTERFEKAITLSHPYVHYILDYVNSITDKEQYVFEGQSGPRHIRSTAVLPRTKEKREYVYIRFEKGFMSPQFAWKIIKYLNPKAWLHLYRHTLATNIAQRGYNEDQLMHWFDWTTSRVAHDYVAKGRRIVEDLSRRTW